MLGIFRKRKEIFTKEEQAAIVEAIQKAEQRTSGEIRVFVERRCSYMDAIDRAAEIFFNLKMQNTDDRNGVLVYIATKDHQLAVFGDEGIHQKVGNKFWLEEVQKMVGKFNRDNYAEGNIEVVTDIGEALVNYFPYDAETDRNELPDDIVFGN